MEHNKKYKTMDDVRNLLKLKKASELTKEEKETASSLNSIWADITISKVQYNKTRRYYNASMWLSFFIGLWIFIPFEMYFKKNALEAYDEEEEILLKMFETMYFELRKLISGF